MGEEEAVEDWGRKVRLPHGVVCLAPGEGCELLLRAGADPRATPHGKTALHVAVEEGHEPVAHALAKADPSTIAIECYGCTPVKLARERDMAGLARRLEAHAQEALNLRAMATDKPPIALSHG